MKALGVAKRCWVMILLVGFFSTSYYLLSTSNYVEIGGQKLRQMMRLATTNTTSSIQHHYHQHPLTHAEISQRFQRRRELLRQACARYKDSPDLFQPLTSRYVVLQSHWPARNTSVAYCPIEKTGSTTWTQLLRQAAKEGKQLPLLKKRGPGDVTQQEDVKFLFVREPYARLLSGYVDKLFSPNSLFWKSTGTYIVQNFRTGDPDEGSLRCGHDVTFEEYARYVVASQRTRRHRNGHFAPLHDHCDLCRADYTYIGHLETLGDDMPFLLNALRLPPRANGSQAPFDSVTIKDNAGWVLRSMRGRIRQCMSMHEACARLWRKWHIRGIISKREPLPVSPEEAENISFTEFVSRALRALQRSGDREERKRQKDEALREAFASLPEGLKAQVADMLRLDCDLFGFDPRPPSVFSSSSSSSSSSLSSSSSSSVPLGREKEYRYFDLSEVRRD